MACLMGKVGLVTGAGGGIGRAIAEAFAREGARVVVADFNADSGQETVSRIQEAGGDAVLAVADVSNEDAVKEMIATAVNQYGALDIACNSAAVSRGSGLIHEFERSVFDDTLTYC
jgi:NAD(P)-dependent dehydrogenase (short-subunit alcohol dehydrogenase family)